MRVVRYDRFEGVDQLWIEQVPVPEAVPGRVVVRVRTSCINPGSLSALNGSSYVPLRDLAGEVVGVGSGVEQLVPKPRDLSWDVAGSLYVTAMAGFAEVMAVRPQRGELVVVSGATGGVGLTAAQLARRAGADVIGVAGPASVGRLDAYGVVPVNDREGTADGIRAAAASRDVDALIDAAGSGYVDLALDLGVAKARINTAVDFPAATRAGVTTWGTREAGGTDALHHMAELAATGELDVPIAASFGLSDVQDAYRTLAQGGLFGRVALHPQA